MLRVKTSKKAIALFITVMFIMLITVSVGIGLTYLNKASNSVKSEQNIIQSAIILDDALKLLNNSPELQDLNSSEELAVFLSEYAFIPLESGGTKISISINSARSKINPNVFTDDAKVEALKSYFVTNMVNVEYVNMLQDVIGGIKEDMSYNTDIFTNHPYFFRDYVTSDKHLKELNEIYKKSFYNNDIENIEMQSLFYTSKDKNSSVDLNYATSSTWELMLSCDKNRADMLSADAGVYSSLEDLKLSEEEDMALKRFNTSFFEPYIDVKIEILQKEKVVNIRFEYDIKSKKGSNFVFEV